MVSEHVDQLVSSETFERTITNFDTNFSKLLLELLDKILDMSSNNYDQRLSNIIYRYADCFCCLPRDTKALIVLARVNDEPKWMLPCFLLDMEGASLKINNNEQPGKKDSICPEDTIKTLLQC